jgi:hypothetical protein
MKKTDRHFLQCEGGGNEFLWTQSQGRKARWIVWKKGTHWNAVTKVDQHQRSAEPHFSRYRHTHCFLERSRHTEFGILAYGATISFEHHAATLQNLNKLFGSYISTCTGFFSDTNMRGLEWAREILRWPIASDQPPAHGSDLIASNFELFPKLREGVTKRHHLLSDDAVQHPRAWTRLSVTWHRSSPIRTDRMGSSTADHTSLTLCKDITNSSHDLEILSILTCVPLQRPLFSMSPFVAFFCYRKGLLTTDPDMAPCPFQSL